MTQSLLPFPDGSESRIPNTSTSLLGVVIEEVADQSIAEAIDGRKVEELDLTATRHAEIEDD